MNTTRRKLLQSGIAASAIVLVGRDVSADDMTFGPWQSLFDGKTLDGWKAVPRIGGDRLFRTPEGSDLTKAELHDAIVAWHRKNGTPQAVFEHTGDWRVIDGAIVGGQQPKGSRLGAYLMTEREFGDMELEYEIRPDWPTDTGVLIRQHKIGTVGFQILCDHRPGGGIGGIFTNGLGGYIAAPFVVDGDRGDDFRVENLRQGKPDERFKQGNISDAVTYEAFREIWNTNDWNRFRVRCVGADPVIMIWINDLMMGTINTADPGVADYDASQIQRRIGTTGHIGLEVHSNVAGAGWNQWERGAVSRWRNLRIRELV